MSKKKKKETGRIQGIIQIILLMLLGAFIGGAGSVVCFMFKGDIVNILREAEKFTGNYSSWVLIFLSVVLFILAPFLTAIAARKMKRWDEDSEEETERLERSIQRYQSILSIFMVGEICISGISIVNHHTDERVFSVIAVFLYIIVVFWNLFFIGRLIKYDKRINPEKRGNYFSWNFNKEWLDSCDEREKLKLFQAGYYTYLRTQFVYLAVFIGLLLLSNAVEVGAVPFLILMVIWVSQSLIYWYEYEKKR